MKPGTVIKASRNAVTIQLSENRTVTLEPNASNLAVGDRAPDDVVQALERAMPQFDADGIKGIVL